MDIFDLDISKFEKRIDELLENFSTKELVKELIENGLIINEYDNTSYYIEEEMNNKWVHKTKTSNIKKKRKLFFKKSKEINLLEAA